MSTALDHAVARLVTMHCYCRPAGSSTERLFAKRYLTPLGATEDVHGNYELVIGDHPRHAWTSHLDTVHHTTGSQRVRLKSGVLTSKGSCLGADDTAGVWLMCELARRRVPGRYLWHYGEEVGCQGSQSLAAAAPPWVATTPIMIALDRRGTQDVITHQCGLRTASDAFALSLVSALNAGHPTFRYASSTRGLFTDSESYASQISECTNISVGYADNHSRSESLNVDHCVALLGALTRLDTRTLVVERDPTEAPSTHWWGDVFAWLGDQSSQRFTCADCQAPFAADLGLCPYCYGELVPIGDPPVYLSREYAAVSRHLTRPSSQPLPLSIPRPLGERPSWATTPLPPVFRFCECAFPQPLIPGGTRCRQCFHLIREDPSCLSA